MALDSKILKGIIESKAKTAKVEILASTIADGEPVYQGQRLELPRETAIDLIAYGKAEPLAPEASLDYTLHPSCAKVAHEAAIKGQKGK